VKLDESHFLRRRGEGKAEGRGGGAVVKGLLGG